MEKSQETDYTAEEVHEYQEDEIVDTGLTAIALYDYQAAADDEISFDPEDLITHVETVINKICLYFMLIDTFSECRSTRVGGEACAKENTDCSRQTTYNCNNNYIFRAYFFKYRQCT